MIAFEVKDMTCGHCVGAITQAVKAQDPGAKLQIDLADHRVEIDSSHVPAAQWRDVIQAAGYTPVAVQTPARPAPTAAASACKGCCCG